MHEQVQLREEHIGLERRTLNTPVADASGIFQDRQIELIETGEDLVVGKEAHVIEEIALRKTIDQRVETVSDTVRHTEVEVEQITPATPAEPSI